MLDSTREKLRLQGGRNRMDAVQQNQAVLDRIIWPSDLDECWGWRGAFRSSQGDQRPVYRRQYAYIWVWEIMRGPWPAGMVFHHTCENPQCVSPHHGEPITQGEHLRLHGLMGDHHQAQKTHCLQGHEYDDENTYTHQRKDGRVERHCRICVREAKRRYRERLASKAGW